MEKKWKVQLLAEKFCFSKLPQFAEIPSVFLKGEMCFISRTDEELTVVSPEFMAPNNVQAEMGFRSIRIAERISLDETGVIAAIIRPLAEQKVSILTISTFDTIYLFFREEVLEVVVTALQKAGYEFIQSE